MKKGMLLVLVLALLSGCALPWAKDEPTSGDGDKRKTTIEVMMFEGGLGSEWFKKTAESYMKENENVTVKVTASPDIHQQLQTRFLSDDVPDLFSPGPSFDIMGVMNDGKLMQLNDALDGKAFASEEKWLDTFEAGQFNLKKNGKIYGIPTVFSAGYIWWYDEKLFEDNGWKVPETMNDLYVLNKQAKEKDIALFAVPGKHPGYYFYGIFMPLVERYGGKEAVLNAYNLHDDAWKSDAFLKAAQESQKMVDEGMYLEGTFGLSHTEAQSLFFQRKALFATAGAWLEGEMSDVIPDDFRLRSINQPAVKEGDGKGAAPVSTGWGGGWYISESSEQKEETVAFLKYLSSKEQVKEMVKSVGTASVVKETDSAIESDALKSALQVLQEADGSYAPTAINDAYPEMTNNIINVYQSLMLKEITPEEFTEKMQAFADQTKKDDNLEKVEFEF